MMVKTIQELNREFMNEMPEAPEASQEPSPGCVDETPEVREASKEAASERLGEMQEYRVESAGAPIPAKARPLWKDLQTLLLKIGAIVLAFVLLFTFLFGFIRYSQPEMNPAVKDGDLVLYYRYNSSGYMPGDTVVLENGAGLQIMRVVATAGDTVDITDGGLYINGALQQEPGIDRRTERYAEGVGFPLTVPEGEIFVLGDNRAASTDSRMYGCVDIKDTSGKVITVIRRRGI